MTYSFFIIACHDDVTRLCACFWANSVITLCFYFDFKFLFYLLSLYFFSFSFYFRWDQVSLLIILHFICLSLSYPLLPSIPSEDHSCRPASCPVRYWFLLKESDTKSNAQQSLLQLITHHLIYLITIYLGDLSSSSIPVLDHTYCCRYIYWVRH